MPDTACHRGTQSDHVHRAHPRHTHAERIRFRKEAAQVRAKLREVSSVQRLVRSPGTDPARIWAALPVLLRNRAGGGVAKGDNAALVAQGHAKNPEPAAAASSIQPLTVGGGAEAQKGPQ